MLSIPARSRRTGLDVPERVCNSAVMGHTMHPAMLPDSQATQASGLAVVRQIKVLAVALAFVDRIAGLTDWTVPDIRATPDLRAQVQKALDQAYDDYYAGRLPPVPQDASSPP
jgi:hypothetical protein